MHKAKSLVSVSKLNVSSGTLQGRGYKSHVLVTRPEPKGQELLELLTKTQINAIYAPLFTYQVAENFQQYKSLITHDPDAIIIFVSVAAVDYAQQLYPLKQWQFSQVIAVGQATQNALKKLGISASSPSVQNTEGLLLLDTLQIVKDKTVMIVRGDQGRELLAKKLKERGANVFYCQSYYRQWLSISKSDIENWYKIRVTCIVNTSVALLEYMLDLLLNHDHSLNNLQDGTSYRDYWLNECTWLVASERIARRANQLGVKKVLNAQSADNQRLLQEIIEME
jgi:uroporphyrinogen-III synthase